MKTLTLELPDTLVQQLQQKQIGEQEIQAIVVATLETWLAKLNQSSLQPASSPGRLAESVTEFARELMQENRELLETLTHH